jgi:hypothetical protein
MRQSVCLSGWPADPRFTTDDPGDCGRLVRVTACERKAVAYIVAAPEPEVAIAIVGSFAGWDDLIEDLGRVSDALLRALSLAPGEFVCTDGARA